jgi:hypothetical protein
LKKTKKKYQKRKRIGVWAFKPRPAFLGLLLFIFFKGANDFFEKKNQQVDNTSLAVVKDVSSVSHHNVG